MARYGKKKKTRPRNQSDHRSFFLLGGLPWAILFRISLALAICLAGYMFYLDRQIKHHIEQGIHPQPAHIFSRSELFSPDAGTRKQQVLEVLEFHGYRKVSKIDGPGSYVVAGNQMDLSLNPVTAHPYQPSVVRLQFNGERLTRILNHSNGEETRQLYLESALIGSLQLGPYQDRITLELHQTPELLIQALLSMEDRHFDSHLGVDLVAIGRALINNLLESGGIQGGSTITQQLVKNIFLSPERSLSRKLIEALMAITMEMRYSKAEILELYINEIFLGQAGNRAVHGFALASEYYFARPLSQLDLHETAVLVGMIPAPSYYNPRRHPERARARRDLVLTTLAKTGAITSSTAKTLSQRPLEIAAHRSSSSNPYPAYIDYLHRQLRQYFDEDVLRSDGLNLYTSLDPHIQDRAQSSLAETLGQLETSHGIESGSLQGAVVVVDIQSGDIVAMVGDRKSGYSGFNRAVDANRPIGSLIKPLVYLTALEKPSEFTLATVVEDAPITIHPKGGEEWSPRNYDKSYRGQTNVLEALTKSYNVPTVRVGLEVGVEKVVETMGRLGVKREIEPYPSLLLGANEHSPVEIAQLYQSIANHGVHTPLRSISHITDRNNQVVARFSKTGKRVIDEETAYLVDYGLKQVVRSGTAARLGQWFSPELQLAGKTGTTDDYRDSWFAGYSGNLLSVVWIGRDDNKPVGLTGSSGAMIVWKELMSSVSLTPGRFEQPGDVVYLDVDPGSGLLYGGGCPERVSIPFNRNYQVERNAPCSGLIGRVQSWFNLNVAGSESGSNSGPKVIDRTIRRNK